MRLEFQHQVVGKPNGDNWSNNIMLNATPLLIVFTVYILCVLFRFSNANFPSVVGRNSLLISSLLSMTIFTITANAQWIAPSFPLLPKADHMMAVAYWNDTITLIGGWWDDFDLFEYDTTAGSFTGLQSSESTSVSIWGYATHWVQRGSLLYMIDPDERYLNTYDLESKTFTAHYPNASMPINVHDAGCLSASDTALYIVGGDVIDAFQMYNFATSSWATGQPLQNARHFHSCAFSHHSNSLYTIGGEGLNSSSRFDSIEFISLIDIESGGEWQYTPSTLSLALAGMRAVPFHSLIYIVGGIYYDGNTLYSQSLVHILDTDSNTVTLMDDALQFDVACTAAIIVDHILYAFGGIFQPDGQSTDKWQYYLLPTDKPTKAPSDDPTSDPSAAPTTPSSASPTSVSPTTGNPTTAILTTPDLSATLLIESTTFAPTRAPMVPLPSGSLDRCTVNHTQYAVTIRADGLSSQQILLAASSSVNASLPSAVFITRYSADDQADSRSSSYVEVVVCIPSDLAFDEDTIKITLREGIVDEYGDTHQLQITVEEEVTSIASLSTGTPTQTIIAVCASAPVVVVCICAAVFYFVRKKCKPVDRRLSKNMADAEAEQLQAREESRSAKIGNDAQVLNETQAATRRDNVDLAIAEARVVPGVVAYARENAHVEDTRGEDNLSLPAQESVLHEEEGVAQNQYRRQSQQVELQTAGRPSVAVAQTNDTPYIR